MKTLARIFVVVVFLAIAQAAWAVPLLTNGGFETGTFAGWTVSDRAGGSGTWSVASGTVTPFSGFPTAGPAAGTFYAVSDQGGAGTHALTQSFGVPIGATSVVLSFDMFVNDQSFSGGIVNPIGLDHTGSANQHARVDLLTAAAGPFDTGAADVIGNFYLGVDAGALPHPYTNYVFDITGLVTPGGTYQIRFAEVDNQLFFHQGVDNVSIEATAAAIPEPGTLALVGAVFLSLVGLRHTRAASIADGTRR